MELTTRTPEIDFSEAPVVWTRIAEFSLYWNGSSNLIPYIEHYLVAVIGEARAKLGNSNPALGRELAQFNEQEATHARYHLRFNKRMVAAGYDLAPLIGRMKDDLKRLRETKSLAFNLAYCAGFESVALFAARFQFERATDYFEGCDPRGADLFLWHVAEEFEHRAACTDAFRALSGNYFMRIYGLLYAFVHVGSAFNEAAAQILAIYRSTMTADERRESRRRKSRFYWRLLRFVLPRALELFLPGYDPARHSVPPRIAQALEFYKSTPPSLERFGFTAG